MNGAVHLKVLSCIWFWSENNWLKLITRQVNLKHCLCAVFLFLHVGLLLHLEFLCIVSQIWAQILCTRSVQMACFIWIDITTFSAPLPGEQRIGLAEVRKVKSGAGSIPSLPRVLRANLLVGSALEQLNEESQAVLPGPWGLVAWAGG